LPRGDLFKLTVGLTMNFFPFLRESPDRGKGLMKQSK